MVSSYRDTTRVLGTFVHSINGWIQLWALRKAKVMAILRFTFHCILKQKEMASLWKIACLKCGSEQSRGRNMVNIHCTVYSIRCTVYSSVQRYDQQITGPYYKQFLHDCLNNTFMHGQHVAYYGYCPL